MASEKDKNSVERILALLDIYGPLLTSKQRDYTRQRYGERMTFSSIAAGTNVSRQSIYDTVRQAVDAMEHYEATLGLLSVTGDGRRASHQNNGRGERSKSLKDSLLAIQRRIRHERVIYNTDWLLREINNLITLFDSKE